MADWEVRAPTLTEDELALARLATYLLDLRPFWPVARRLFISWMSRQFDSEGEYFDDPWQELSPDYLAWKEVNFPGKRILSAEGDLRKAATSPRSIPLPLSLTLIIDPYTHGAAAGQAGGTIASWYGKEIDPEWFQKGTDRMPSRPLVFDALPPGDAMAELEEAASLYAEQMIVRAGLR